MPEEIVDSLFGNAPTKPKKGTRPTAQQPPAEEVVDSLDLASTSAPNDLDLGESGAGGKKPKAPTLTWGQAAYDLPIGLLEGAGAGVASTVKGGYNLARKALPSLPPAPQALEEASSNTRMFGPRAGQENDLTLRVGKGAEQVGEFFVPGGLVSKLATKVGGATKVGQVAATAGLEALSSAGVTELQTGGDNEAAAKAALMSGVASGAFNTIAGVLKSIPPGWVYQGLKFPKKLGEHEVDDILRTAVDEGWTISKTGKDAAAATAASARQAKGGVLAASGGQPIDPNMLTRATQELRAMAQRAGDKAFERRVDGAEAQFMAQYGAKPATAAKTVTSPVLGANGQAITTTIPAMPATPPSLTVDQAEGAKNALYGLVKQAYGTFSSNKAGVQKAIAHDLKEAIEQKIPAIKEMNQDIRKAKVFEAALGEYLRTHGLVNNTNLAVHAMLNSVPSLFSGSPMSMKYGIPASILYEAVANPRVRSTIAIMGPDAMKAVGSGTAKVGGAATSAYTRK